MPTAHSSSWRSALTRRAERAHARPCQTACWCHGSSATMPGMEIGNDCQEILHRLARKLPAGWELVRVEPERGWISARSHGREHTFSHGSHGSGLVSRR
jgi:hypothetical protein